MTELLAGRKRTDQIQVNMLEFSPRNRDPRNLRTNMGLYLALLAQETQPCPEADILGKLRPPKPEGQKSPGGTNTRVRDPRKRTEDWRTERRQQIGKGWTEWTGRKGRWTEGGQEWQRNLNRRRRDQGQQRRQRLGRRQGRRLEKRWNLDWRVWIEHQQQHS